MLRHHTEDIELAQKVRAGLEQRARSGVLILDIPIPLEHVAIHDDLGGVVGIDLATRGYIHRRPLALELIQRLARQTLRGWFVGTYALGMEL